MTARDKERTFTRAILKQERHLVAARPLPIEVVSSHKGLTVKDACFTEVNMPVRYATRFLPALVLGAVALATPARAHDSYDSEYQHYLRDRYEAQRHRAYDRRESFGHAISDLFRYGTTDRYSSLDHYYRDQRRDYEHYLRDQHRAYNHYRRDRWDSSWNDGYGYSRDGYDHWR
jgi:hypothetical protein